MTSARVRQLIAALMVAALPLGAALPLAAAEADGGYRRTIDITFPVAGPVSYANSYDAARSGGRVHQASDIMADKMQRIHAAKGGTVCYATGLDGAPPSYGMMLTICGNDGLQYRYIHINNDTPGTDDGASDPRYAYAPGLYQGAKVARGQFIAYVGDSGNAETTAPHLHFEIHDPAMDDERIQGGPYDPYRIDPHFSLKRAEAQDDYPGKRYPKVVDAFSDIAFHPFRAQINALAAGDVVTGCGGGAFCPDEPATRGQMARFLAAALGLDGGPDAFADDDGHRYESHINALAGAGVVSGCSATRFCAGQRLTRGQMATFLTRAYRLQPAAVTFGDVAPDDVHAANIGALSAAGVTTGCGESAFCPGQHLRRGQLAVFLSRMPS
jgi:hypothetical protein